MEPETKNLVRQSRIPLLSWLPSYSKALLPGDIMAGSIAAIVLLPQAMAYAMLAGLPPQSGLYSCILPILLYAVLGSSRILAVGPVGLTSLMVGSVIAGLNLGSEAEIVFVAVNLALLSGGLLVLMFVFRFGSIVNFISYPVLSGFTSAAALIIGVSQLKHLLGIDVARGAHFYETITNLVNAAHTINLATTTLGIAGIAVILGIRTAILNRFLVALLPKMIYAVVSKSGPLIAVIGGIVFVWAFKLDRFSGVSIVGEIPSGLPGLLIPRGDWELFGQLLPMATVIAIVGFLSSVSVAKALASKNRQKIDANQELLALGCANIGAAFSGGYPVAGGLGRSMVSFSAGANTQLASMLTALLIAVSLIFLTPLLYYLPRAVLAAIIIVAVFGLFDLKTLKHVWVYDKSEAACLLITFFAVLIIGIEWGIFLGALVSIGIHLRRSSEPHIAIVGRVGNTEHFRNIERHSVTTCSHVIAMRVDENLYFANTSFLEDYIMALIADHQQAKHLVLICSAVNKIDSSALELLDTLIERLRYVGVSLHLAEVKGPVMDRLKKTSFLARLEPGQVFLSTHVAMQTLDSDQNLTTTG